MKPLQWVGSLSIRIKLSVAFGLILGLMATASGLQMLVFSGYMQDYNQMLDSIGGANAINGQLKTELDSQIRDIVNGKQAFTAGRQYELLQSMDGKLSELAQHESDMALKKAIHEVQQTMETLRERVDRLGQQLQSDATVDEQEATFDYITIITSSVEEQVQVLIREKLIVSEAVQEEMRANFSRNIVYYSAAFIVVLALSAWIAWLLSRSISKPIRRLSAAASAVADGRLEVAEVPVTSRDEVGRLCHSFNQMTGNLRSLIYSVREANARVSVSSEQIQRSMLENRRAGEEIAGAAQIILESLSLQNQRVQTSAAVFDAVFASFHDVVHHAEQINSHADESVKLAHEGSAQILDFVSQFAALRETVQQVDEETGNLYKLIEEMAQWLGMIQTIASQTNILSLNASIEAARASQSGRSFSVIAQQVKELAGQTSKLAANVDEQMLVVKERMAKTNARMKESTLQLDVGDKKAVVAQQVFESIRSMNEHVRQDVGTITQDMQGVGGGMNGINETMSALQQAAHTIQQQIDNIAAMTEEQVASLDEVGAASDTLIGHIRELKRAAGSNES